MLGSHPISLNSASVRTPVYRWDVALICFLYSWLTDDRLYLDHILIFTQVLTILGDFGAPNILSESRMCCCQARPNISYNMTDSAWFSMHWEARSAMPRRYSAECNHATDTSVFVLSDCSVTTPYQHRSFAMFCAPFARTAMLCEGGVSSEIQSRECMSVPTRCLS